MWTCSPPGPPPSYTCAAAASHLRLSIAKVTGHQNLESLTKHYDHQLEVGAPLPLAPPWCGRPCAVPWPRRESEDLWIRQFRPSFEVSRKFVLRFEGNKWTNCWTTNRLLLFWISHLESSAYNWMTAWFWMDSAFNWWLWWTKVKSQYTGAVVRKNGTTLQGVTSNHDTFSFGRRNVKDLFVTLFNRPGV